MEKLLILNIQKEQYQESKYGAGYCGGGNCDHCGGGKCGKCGGGKCASFPKQVNKKTS